MVNDCCIACKQPLYFAIQFVYFFWFVNISSFSRDMWGPMYILTFDTFLQRCMMCCVFGFFLEAIGFIGETWVEGVRVVRGGHRRRMISVLQQQEYRQFDFSGAVNIGIFKTCWDAYRHFNETQYILIYFSQDARCAACFAFLEVAGFLEETWG